MGRAPDDLYDIGAKKVMAELAMLIINRFEIPVTSSHIASMVKMFEKKAFYYKNIAIKNT
ncbi:MAG: hypothetical protein MJB12_02365 [Firmicutes bacterium]|nr:hypothetical protein [Bacillota bacterium]